MNHLSEEGYWTLDLHKKHTRGGWVSQPGKPDFGVVTISGAGWPENGRYMRWTLPTNPAAARGTGNRPILEDSAMSKTPDAGNQASFQTTVSDILQPKTENTESVPSIVNDQRFENI
jgi:hypothetical protein